MAPRSSKGKSSAKDTPTAAATAIPSLANRDELGDEFHEVYNDLLVTKIDLVETSHGSARKRLASQMGEELVSAYVYPIAYSFLTPLLSSRLDCQLFSTEWNSALLVRSKFQASNLCRLGPRISKLSLRRQSAVIVRYWLIATRVLRGYLLPLLYLR